MIINGKIINLKIHPHTLVSLFYISIKKNNLGSITSINYFLLLVLVLWRATGVQLLNLVIKLVRQKTYTNTKKHTMTHLVWIDTNNTELFVQDRLHFLRKILIIWMISIPVDGTQHLFLWFFPFGIIIIIIIIITLSFSRGEMTISYFFQCFFLARVDRKMNKPRMAATSVTINGSTLQNWFSKVPFIPN